MGEFLLGHGLELDEFASAIPKLPQLVPLVDLVGERESFDDQLEGEHGEAEEDEEKEEA